ncbi:MAG: hypothetical protein Q9226_007962 [Calogaya cf. arnoldii]
MMHQAKYPDTRHVDIERRSYTADKGAGKQDALAQTDTHTSDDSTNSSLQHDIPPTSVLLKGRLARWNEKIEGLAGLEARGIIRVLPDEKHAGGIRHYLQMMLLWFSINLTSANIITGLLGRLLFSLGWTDAVCIAIFATALAACSVSYISTFGPASGNRTMIACILNIILQLGWGIIGCIIAGQMFSAINGKRLTIAVGCVIAALLIGCIATFGIAYVHVVER